MPTRAGTFPVPTLSSVSPEGARTDWWHRPVSGGSAPALQIPSAPDTAEILQSISVFACSLDVIPLLKDKMGILGASGIFLQAEKNHYEEASSFPELWGEGPAGFPVPVGLEDDPTAPLWLLRAQGIRHVLNAGRDAELNPRRGSDPPQTPAPCPWCQRIVVSCLTPHLCCPLSCANPHSALTILILSHR